MGTLSRNFENEVTLLNAVAVTTGTTTTSMNLSNYMGAHVTIEADFPVSAVDDLIVEMLAATADLAYDTTPLKKFRLAKETDPNQISLVVSGPAFVKFKCYRSGTTNTITVTIKFKRWNYVYSA